MPTPLRRHARLGSCLAGALKPGLFPRRLRAPLPPPPSHVRAHEPNPPANSPATKANKDIVLSSRP
eukprot:361016-Chlamydomonas_euryale.AAC.2